MRSLGWVAIGAGLAAAGAVGWAGVAQDDRSWTREFTVEPGELGPTGRNPPGVGLMQDGPLRIVSHGFPGRG